MERRGGGERRVEIVRERMYVGGLNSEVTGELLAEVFSQFGLVRTMLIIRSIVGFNQPYAYRYAIIVSLLRAIINNLI